MKSVFNTLFSILAGGCAALLALKFVSRLPEEQEDYQTKMRSYTAEPASAPASTAAASASGEPAGASSSGRPARPLLLSVIFKG